jgi:hypothetical protein
MEGNDLSHEDRKEVEGNSDSDESLWEMDMHDVLLEEKGFD